MLRPRQGAPVPRAGGCREARASRRKPRSRRELAQPEGLGVCRARCVPGSPGSTYPAPVPTQRGAGRPAGARARSACTPPRCSPPSAARDTGRCGGVRLGLRAPAELSPAWDNKAVGIMIPGEGLSLAQELALPTRAFQFLKSYPVRPHTDLPHASSPVLGETPTCSLPRCSCSLLHNQSHLAESMWDTGAQAPSPPSPHPSPARCLLIEQGGEKNHLGGFFSCFAFQKDSCC